MPIKEENQEKRSDCSCVSRDDRAGTRSEHVLKKRYDGRSWRDQIGNRRHQHREPASPHREPASPPREPASPPREPASPPREPAPPPREPASPPREPSSPPREPASPPREPAPPHREPAPPPREPASPPRAQPAPPPRQPAPPPRQPAPPPREPAPPPRQAVGPRSHPRRRGPSLSSRPRCPCRRAPSRTLRADGRLLAWLPARAKGARYALNRLPQSVSNVVNLAARRSAALD